MCTILCLFLSIYRNMAQSTGNWNRSQGHTDRKKQKTKVQFVIGRISVPVNLEHPATQRNSLQILLLRK